jgi:sulfur carrier protein
MKIKLNGSEIEVSENISVLELMRMKEFDPGKYVAIVNDDVVPRSKISEITLKKGDEVEIITMMGGG